MQNVRTERPVRHVCPVILEIKQLRLLECRLLWIMIMNDSVTKVCNELIKEFVAFHFAQTLHNLIGIHFVHTLPFTYTGHYLSYFIISGSLLPSEMAEVFVVTWIAYFSLVLIVSKLSLHKARFASISNPHVSFISHIMLLYISKFGQNESSGKSSWSREGERFPSWTKVFLCAC